MRVLGIIPARGGSKGIPNKNIKLLGGKPLIAYAIEAARESKLLTHFIVSTDSEEIIEMVNKYECSFYKRSDLNSQDTSPIEPVIREVIQSLVEQYDLIILLQPTAPIRIGVDIDNVINMFVEDNTLDSVVSVIELKDIHPARMYEVDDTLKMKSLNQSDEKKRRQDLNPVYLRNGCIYAVTTKYFEETEKLMATNKKAYIMPESKWLNIDTERDLIIAECLIKLWKEDKLT